MVDKLFPLLYNESKLWKKEGLLIFYSVSAGILLNASNFSLRAGE